MLKRNLHINQLEQIMSSILDEFYSNMRKFSIKVEDSFDENLSDLYNIKLEN